MAFLLIFLVLFIPLDTLEFLSLEIVGGPPINGLTWMQGVDALGGPISIRFLAIMGLILIFMLIPLILKWQRKSINRQSVKNIEIIVFMVIAIIFFFINILIGYSWWDPEHPLGLGPLFIPSIISLVILGLIPELAKKLFHFERSGFAESTQHLSKITLLMCLVAFGYGLISLIWHCCAFFEPKMFFFFFIIKLIQLWAMTSFFFKYGLPLLLSKTPEWLAYLLISVLFGICYPWHTFGFAITFTIFGILLCYLTQKTNSYLTGLLLLYFAYIFHAGLAWQGAIVTFTVIYPISLLILGVSCFLVIKRNESFKF